MSVTIAGSEDVTEKSWLMMMYQADKEHEK